MSAAAIYPNLITRYLGIRNVMGQAFYHEPHRFGATALPIRWQFKFVALSSAQKLLLAAKADVFDYEEFHELENASIFEAEDSLPDYPAFKEELLKAIYGWKSGRFFLRGFRRGRRGCWLEEVLELLAPLAGGGVGEVFFKVC